MDNNFLFSEIKTLMTQIRDRADDALKWHKKAEYGTMLHEISYLREYLDKVEDGIKKCGPDKIAKTGDELQRRLRLFG